MIVLDECKEFKEDTLAVKMKGKIHIASTPKGKSLLYEMYKKEVLI